VTGAEVAAKFIAGGAQISSLEGPLAPRREEVEKDLFFAGHVEGQEAEVRS
jgi:hypothetical protein